MAGMRARFLGLGLAVLLLGAPSASAIPAADEVVNWTLTFIGGDFALQAFLFDEESPWELSFEEPIIHANPVFDGDSLVGTVLQVTLPNFFDPLPEKNVYLAFSGVHSGPGDPEAPYVIAVTGADAPFGGGGPAVPVIGTFVAGECHSDNLCEEEWRLRPNPDFETITAFIPEDFAFTELEILTQSVPEPGLLALVGGGVLGLLAAGRRRA